MNYHFDRTTGHRMSIYQIRLHHATVVDDVGLARGKPVGLKTATKYDNAAEARQILLEWLDGGSGLRREVWHGEVVRAERVTS